MIALVNDYVRTCSNNDWVAIFVDGSMATVAWRRRVAMLITILGRAELCAAFGFGDPFSLLPGLRLRFQELQALLPTGGQLVEVKVREGKVKEALNRAFGSLVDESEDEGRLVQIARSGVTCARKVFAHPGAQVDLAEHVILAEAVDPTGVGRAVVRTGCHFDLQVDICQQAVAAAGLKLADACVVQPGLRRVAFRTEPAAGRCFGRPAIFVWILPQRIATPTCLTIAGESAQVVDDEIRLKEVHLEVALGVIVRVIPR